jgi:hypothetical protein
MTQEPLLRSDSGPRASLSWIQAWAAGFKGDYAALFSRSQAHLSRAMAWVVISTAAGAALNLWIDSILHPPSIMLMFLPELTLYTVLLATMSLLLGAALIHVTARLLKGTGSYTDMVYALAAYAAPATFVFHVLSPLPYLQWLTIPLGLYALLLHVKAIRAVHRVGWGRAIAANGLLLVVLGVLLIALFLGPGPVVGPVFSDVVQGLQM